MRKAARGSGIRAARCAGRKVAGQRLHVEGNPWAGELKVARRKDLKDGVPNAIDKI